MSFQDYLNNRQSAFGAMSENLKKEINIPDIIKEDLETLIS